MRTAVFIDGHWLHRASAAMAIDVDFKRLRAAYFPEDNEVTTLEFFSIEPVNAEGISNVRRLLDWLDQNGFRIRALEVPQDQKDSIREGRTELMVWLALEIVNAANRGADNIVVWSADRSLIRAVYAAQQAGASVTLVSDSTSISGTLKRSADIFVEVAAFKDIICQLKKVPA